MSDTILKAANISKCFRIYTQEKTLFRLSKSLLSKNPLKEELWALKNISLEIFKGEKIALLGANGAGKTTLLRILSDIIEPTTGTIEGTLPHPLFRYGVGLDASLPVIDNVYLLGAFHGLTVAEVNSRMDAIIQLAELAPFLYVPVRKLSTGQRQRLLFSVFIQSDYPFLAFDESTSSADLKFKKTVHTYFKNLMTSDKTVLLTSHSLPFLEKYCTRAIWLDRGEIRREGNPAEVIEAYKIETLGS